MDSIDRYIGHRMREKRQKLSLTLSDVASKLGISLQQVQKYEQGKSRIAAGLLYKIAHILNVVPSYFYEGFDDTAMRHDLKEQESIAFDQTRSLNILLIEDDPADELLIRNVFSDCDCAIKIFATHDGESALSFLRPKSRISVFPRPDLILLDLNIPKRDGHYVLKEIKRDQTLQDIPVVILTNSIRTQEMLSAYRHYASGYICKPFDFDRFKSSLMTLVEYWGSVVVLPKISFHVERTQ